MKDAHNHEDIDDLKAALVGRSVVSVNMHTDRARTVGKWGPPVEGEVHLDDGTLLLLAGNEGGCSCGADDYNLTQLAEMPINGIMDVQVAMDELEPADEGDQTYRIFVLAFGGKFELATFDGSDGNGYYGTGFWFEVVR